MEPNKFLILNSVKCLSCQEILVSYNRHHYTMCKCDNQTCVDGGLQYMSISGVNFDLIESKSVFSDADFSIIRESLYRGGRGEDGTNELKYVLLKNIEDSWLENIIIYEEKFRKNSEYLTFYKQEIRYRILNKIINDDNK